jgi:MFS family permease
MLIALAPSLGPSYGGFVTQVASWRLSFWMIMPIALIAGVIAIVNMPQVFPQQKLIFPVGQFALLPWIIHRISKKQRNPTIHTGLRCFGVSPIGCAYMLRLSQRKPSRKRGFTPSQL